MRFRSAMIIETTNTRSVKFSPPPLSLSLFSRNIRVFLKIRIFRRHDLHSFLLSQRLTDCRHRERATSVMSSAISQSLFCADINTRWWGFSSRCLLVDFFGARTLAVLFSCIWPGVHTYSQRRAASRMRYDQTRASSQESQNRFSLTADGSSIYTYAWSRFAVRRLPVFCFPQLRGRESLE